MSSHHVRRLGRLGSCAALIAAAGSPACTAVQSEPTPATSSLTVRNRSYFDVNVYVVSSSGNSQQRMGTVVGGTIATFPLRAMQLQPGGVLVVRVHPIGTSLSWTSPAVSVGDGLLAVLNVNSDGFGDCSTSDLHTVVVPTPHGPGGS